MIPSSDDRPAPQSQLAPPATPPATPPPHRTRRSAALVWSLSAVLVVIGGGFATAAAVTTDVVARNLQSEAWSAWTVVDDRHDEAVADETEAAREAHELVAEAGALAPAVTAELVGETELTAFQDGLDELRSASDVDLDDAEPNLSRLDPAHPGFTPVWERYSATGELRRHTPERLTSAEAHERSAQAVDDARVELEARIDDLATAAVRRIDEEVAAYPSATNRTRIDLRSTAESLGELDGTPSADDFTTLAERITALRDSHAAEEARKLEPSYAVRSEIEAFARSLSAGIPLDFAWAYEVAGVTSDSWIAGTAEFDENADDDWALITLSESVADGWPDANVRALVVHEVGHTQVLRPECAAIFDAAPFDRDHEMWATAWSIGRGNDLPGSGIEAYGRPSDAQIEASKACR